MLAALLLSFAVIFVAEMGETQLVAMMFALRYRWWIVLSAIFTATIAVHLVSVDRPLPGRRAADAFTASSPGRCSCSSACGLARRQPVDDEASKTEKASAPAFFVVTSAFSSPSWATRRCCDGHPGCRQALDSGVDRFDHRHGCRGCVGDPGRRGRGQHCRND
jgi:putative Ca2+/H+ antiporter (TMEM165/GDT1 family)